ncbi:MAG: hypothetical protein ACON35_06505 [Candidatus Marinamargulisbacteria bacterium]
MGLITTNILPKLTSSKNIIKRDSRITFGNGSELSLKKILSNPARITEIINNKSLLNQIISNSSLVNKIFKIQVHSSSDPILKLREKIDYQVALNLARDLAPNHFLTDEEVIESQEKQLVFIEKQNRPVSQLNKLSSSLQPVLNPPCPSTTYRSLLSTPQTQGSREDQLNNYLDLLHSMKSNQTEHSSDALQTIETLKTNISRLLGFKPTVRPSDNINYSFNIRSLVEPVGFSRVETLGDGNCFLNSFSLLLLDFGTNNPDRQGVILSMLNNDVAKQNDDFNLTTALFNNRDISSSDKQRLITRRLKQLLKQHVEHNFDVSQDASHEMKSRLFKLRLTYNDFQTSNDAIRQRYLHEIERDGQWLGMESMDFVMDMFGRYNLNFNGNRRANAVSVFSSNATQNDPSLSYGLTNPYGAHWTLLKQA